MHGPACIFWADLTPFSRELLALLGSPAQLQVKVREAVRLLERRRGQEQQQQVFEEEQPPLPPQELGGSLQELERRLE